jgi:ABC-type dipeptide/oligopeptide/nickel transport system permease component
MITVYLCGISAVLAALIGMPIGIYSATRDRLWSWVQVAIDTLQTLPSFVYLMPAVMLFRVGDFTAMIAVVAFAMCAGHPLHCTRHPQGGSETDRGRACDGLHRMADPHAYPAQAGAARNPARV